MDEVKYYPARMDYPNLCKPYSNADRIRNMSDEELNDLFNEIYNAGADDAVAYAWGNRKDSFEWTMDWLQQPAEEVDNGKTD